MKTRRSAVAPALRLDRAAIMRDAHARYRRRRGTDLELSFGEALRRAWAAALIRREAAVVQMAA